MVALAVRRGLRSNLLWAAAALLVLAAAFLLAPEAEATHFRAGTMEWDNNPVLEGTPLAMASPASIADLRITAVLRATYFCSPCVVGQNIGAQGPISWGDGTTTSNYNAYVVQYDPVQDLVHVQFWTPGTDGLSHQYPGPGTYTVTWSSCCRLTASMGHRNNPDRVHHLETSIGFSAPNNSPQATSPVLQGCPSMGICTFPIQVSDPDGHTLTYRLSTTAEAIGPGPYFWYQPGPCGPRCANPAPATIDPTTGVVTWNTTGALQLAGTNLYSMQVMVEDGQTKVPLDFFIRINPGPSPPVCTSSGSAGYIGTTFHFYSQGQGNNWSTPGGTPTTGAGSTHSSTYSQAGTYTATVTNPLGSSTCKVMLFDPNPPPPPPPPPPPGPAAHTHSLGLNANGNNLFAQAIASDAGEAPADNVTVDFEVCQAGGSCYVDTAVTDLNGVAKVKWHNFPGPGTYTACVTAMTKPGWTWNSAAGHASGGNCETVTV